MYRTLTTLFNKGMKVERPTAYTKGDRAKVDYTKTALSIALQGIDPKEFDKKYDNGKGIMTTDTVVFGEGEAAGTLRHIKISEPREEENKKETKVVIYIENSPEEKEATGVDNYNISVYPHRRDDYVIKVSTTTCEGVKSKEKLGMVDGQMVSLTNPVQGQAQ